MTEGVERYRELERQALTQALAEGPYGILTLGDATLLDDSNLRAVTGGSVLVALERDLANCYWRFQALKDELPESAWHPFFAEPLRSIEQVRPFYRERHGALASAHHTVELEGRPLGEMVEVLAGLLPVA
jgi:shikimate kinase